MNHDSWEPEGVEQSGRASQSFLLWSFQNNEKEGRALLRVAQGEWSPQFWAVTLRSHLWLPGFPHLSHAGVMG